MEQKRSRLEAPVHYNNPRYWFWHLLLLAKVLNQRDNELKVWTCNSSPNSRVESNLGVNSTNLIEMTSTLSPAISQLESLIRAMGYPVVSEWTSYSAALADSDVYAVRMNTVVGRWLHHQGTIDQNAIRNATAIGTQYLWDQTARSQAASILWTTSEPFTPAVGWPGSVLCLGRPTDQSSKAIVFQNFEVQCYSSIDPMTGKSKDIIVKAGFLLPESVRSSIIVSSKDQHRQRGSNTVEKWWKIPLDYKKGHDCFKWP